MKSLNLNNEKKKKKESDISSSTFSSILTNKKKNRHAKTQNDESLNPSNLFQTISSPINGILNSVSTAQVIQVVQPIQPPIPSLNYSILLEPTRQDYKNEQKTSQDISNDHHKELFIDTPQSLDPFNDCELKTINDLEELKTILQNHQEHQQQQQQQLQNKQNENNRLYLNSVKICAVDSFGLPIVDLDINSNKI